ncbi:plasmid partitioning protein RepB [Rhizobium sp. Root708]|uniref:plasmid partitioning protein RepB n=1 Tax=Rhizobium sp. Root708 TaxID=1736592 RepID=UPI0006F74F30|nr:plasmid partitioning protein RepB [Rhizobium sp. Root708]KRB49167.1 plasmid partitioning protein RepB [Rhizobium sp. Root708]
MNKSNRKSIVASFGLLSASLESGQAPEHEQEQEQQPVAAPAPPSVKRVGAGVIGAAHRAIDDIRTERDRLKAMVEAGTLSVREIDPSLMDPSPYPDRLPDDDAAAFAQFKRSIEAEGQKVPVQVRKHPASPDRYQIVYGHRRWRALSAIGRAVLAIEIEISDADLILAQGIENASRQDLTWIERALFASRLDEASIKTHAIKAALSIDDAELARMRGVYRAIPRDVIEAIGRAPKVGRPRWGDLAKAISDNAERLASLRAALASTEGIGGSDQRFLVALQAIKSSAPKPEPAPIATGSGQALGEYLASAKEVRIKASGALGTEFLKFVEAELPALAERFVHNRSSGA